MMPTLQACSPTQALAQAFARRMVMLARLHGSSEAVCQRVWRAAFALSVATADGHVCVPLSDLHDEPATHELFPDDAPALAAWRDALLGSGICAPQAAADSDAPLVLDARDRLYLARYYDYERRLAHALAVHRTPDAGGAAQGGLPVNGNGALLARYFGAGDIRADASGGAPEVNWQMAAAALALRQHIVILSGGPGTGKTTTVVGLLACLLERQPGLRVALAAPTGKAAQRMQEALAARAEHLPSAVRNALPAAALTLHRLLGVVPQGARRAGRRFRHHADNPLPYDLVVIDEASMIDVSLATHLLEAVPVGARLIMLGDKDQLAAVEAGAVFGELSASPALSPTCREALACDMAIPAALLQSAQAPAVPSPLRDSVIWLERNYRFGGASAIGRVAEGIKHGRVSDVRQVLAGGDPLHGEQSVVLYETARPSLDSAHLAQLADGYAEYGDRVAALRRAESDRAATELFAAFNRFRVLCATRGGRRGVEALNGQLASAFVQRVGLGSTTLLSADAWYVGRPVIVTRNDYALGLFNGDIGIALPAGSDGALRVAFPGEHGAYRLFSPASLPLHETAFAMTVHKSQGSEFERVAVVLPEQGSRVLSRELIYTAVTRARTSVALYASWPVVAAAVATPSRRASGLTDRLFEALGDPIP
ncbi:exodeoxyribonuclease V subunit alpha [Pandoraea sp.]|uniref:exodeoxyribonuclease V subunit alpha n=1 Tax=Pandoraea sp. TaxID=1883445 RepID=UPI0012110BF4|nr:exodeoxyribonuclease V subunit alpha [Pandoraea sp.]TAL55767.1 MAG: exodeoxyribonuclease V subunit alpha [Pandoraea sp.]TAM19371.1 MAG: exodeoxyribonuclease V subunit alpha [Pandoraea sp.]